MLRLYFHRPRNSLLLNLSIRDILSPLSASFLSYDKHGKTTIQNYSCYFTDTTKQNKQLQKYFLDGQTFTKNRSELKHLHTSDEVHAVKIPSVDIGQAISSLRTTKMIELKNAPVPAFWLGLIGLLPFAFPPIQALLFGYSPLLGTVQVGYAAAVLSFVGGAKWGSMVPGNKADVTWDNIILSTVPTVIATAGVVVPPMFGFLVISFGMLVALAIDLVTSKYPPWFISLRCFLTTASTAFLLLSMLQCLIH